MAMGDPQPCGQCGKYSFVPTHYGVTTTIGGGGGCTCTGLPAINCSDESRSWAKKVVNKIAITIEIDEDGTIIVSDNIFFRYGTGDTLKQAMGAYVEGLTVSYEILEESISDEHPENEEYLNFMKEFVALSEHESEKESAE